MISTAISHLSSLANSHKAALLSLRRSRTHFDIDLHTHISLHQLSRYRPGEGSFPVRHKFPSSQTSHTFSLPTSLLWVARHNQNHSTFKPQLNRSSQRSPSYPNFHLLSSHSLLGSVHHLPVSLDRIPSKGKGPRLAPFSFTTS